MERASDYRIPGMTRIGRSDETEKLYRLEDARDAAIRRAGTEWAAATRALGVPQVPEPPNFYRDILPQALFDSLESFDHRASLIAALAFVRFYEARDKRAGLELVAECRAAVDAAVQS